MQALTPAETAEVKAHLDTCASCRSTLAEITADVSLIGLSVPQKEMPSGARQRFIAAIENTPATNATPRKGPVPLRSPEGGGRRAGFGWVGWLGWVAAVAAIVVACYLGYRSHELQRELAESHDQIAQDSALQAQYADVLRDLKDTFTSPEAKRVTLTETKRPEQPIGHVNYLAKSGMLVFVASNLHPVPKNKTYELWLIPASGKAPIPAGLFRPDAAGSASVVEPMLPKGVEAKAFGVTVEEASGSVTPTLPIVMAGQ